MELLEPTSDDRTFGMMAHLAALLGFFFPFGGIIGPLVVWSLKKESSRFIDENGKEALNFNITWTIVLAFLWMAFAAMLLGNLPFLISLENLDDLHGPFPLGQFFTAFILLIPIGLGYLLKFILMIVGTVTASGGKVYRYPLSMRLIR